MTVPWVPPEAATVVTVLVTGSRFWTDREAIEHAFDAEETLVRWCHPGPYRFRLVHGACPPRTVKGWLASADILAASVARMRRWEVVESRPGVDGFPADWDTHGDAAGPIRNKLMVDYMRAQEGVKVCITFPLPGGRGTPGCRKLAVRAGIRTWDARPGLGQDPELAA